MAYARQLTENAVISTTDSEPSAAENGVTSAPPRISNAGSRSNEDNCLDVLLVVTAQENVAPRLNAR